MADQAPDRLVVSLDDAIREPSLKHQRELYPWKKEYEKLNYDTDSIAKTEITERGRGPSTLSAVLLPGLEKTNDKRTAWKKFKAICARLVLAHFNPDKVKVGYTIRLENNVLYIERPKAKRAKKLGLKLKKDAAIDGGYEELQPEKEKLIELSQREWKDLSDAISKRIVWDVIIALYGPKYAPSKPNRAKRKQIWIDEMKETEAFTGTPVQNGKILDFLKKKVEELKAGKVALAEPAPAAPAEPVVSTEPAAPVLSPAGEPPAPESVPKPEPGPEAAPIKTIEDLRAHLEAQRDYWTNQMGKAEPYTGAAEQRAEVEEHFARATQPKAEPETPAPAEEPRTPAPTEEPATPAPVEEPDTLSPDQQAEAQRQADAMFPKAAIEAIRTIINSDEFGKVFTDFYAHPNITQERKDEVEKIWRTELREDFNRLASRADGLPENGEDPIALGEEIKAYKENLDTFVKELKEELARAGMAPMPEPEPTPEPEPLSPENQARLESAQRRAFEQRDAQFTPPAEPDNVADAHIAYLVDHYGKAGGKLKRIYDALSPEDQKNIEEDPQWRALIFVRNGIRYNVEPIADGDSVRLKLENNGRFTTLTIPLDDLPGEIEKLAQANQGNETPRRPEVYPAAEEVFGTNLINPNRTEEGLLRNVFHKIELSDEQQVITDSAGKQYRLDLRNGVKDNYENEPSTVTRLVTCYPVDDFGNFDKQGHLKIQFRRNDRSAISVYYSNTTGDRSAPSTPVELQKDHPLLRLELVR